VREGKTQFVPKTWEKTYFDWLENIQPWCVSRQLWWGHQIPAWYCVKCDAAFVKRGRDNAITLEAGATPIVGREPPSKCPRCGGGKAELVQDPDVLDTWFSSATWPFSTLGWPDKSPELKKFYPTSTLITAYDIIFFWVARMMMFGIEFMGDVPFKDVYIHGLVRDEHGDKMSKSKGNVLDPLELMDKYGTDALRFTVASFAGLGSDVRLSPERIQGYRNFANKIWNASGYLRESRGVALADGPLGTTLADRWIVSRLQSAIDQVRHALKEYRYNDAAATLYQFTWGELCDWYREMIKPALTADPATRDATMRTGAYVFDQLLRLLHPIMPFITEEVWQQLPVKRETTSIVIAKFPHASPDRADANAEDEVAVMQEVVTAVRNIRGVMNIDPKKKVSLLAATGELQAREMLERLRPLILDLGRLESFEIHESLDPPKGAAAAVVEGIELFVPLAGLVDPKVESVRLAKRIAELDGFIAGVKKKLENENFVKNAPEDVVIEQREKLLENEDIRKKLAASLDRLKEIG
jgi:valyl-tRNA synthetase